MPKVSVIMPVCHTKEAYLRQAIESILGQTFTDFEFLILDDCPENSSESVVKSYRDQRIVYSQNERNLGIAKSYNKLLALAQGEYIAVMNHDDISLPQRLEKEVAFLDDHPEVGLVGTGYKKFGKYNRFRKIINPEEDVKIKALLLFKSAVHHPTTMFRKDLIRDYHIVYDSQFISLNDRKFYQDVGQVSRLCNMPVILYKYRFHAHMTSKVNRDDIVKERYLFHRLFFERYGIEMTHSEKEIFDNCIARGRCRIRSYDLLVKIKEILEKLVLENEQKHFLPETEFAKTCGRYLVKKCKNAAVYGRINSAAVLQATSLPLDIPVVLKLWNHLVFWKKEA